MNTIVKFWIFIIIQNGIEKIMAWPDSDGREVPLLYTDKNRIGEVGMRKAMQEYADVHNLYIELREYQVIPSSVEKFYPSKLNYNA